MNRETFRKEERLCHKQDINNLFVEGNTLHTPGFVLKWRITSNPRKHPLKLLISVPKRNFKRAVDRNRVKRLIREAFRHNKTILYELLNEQDIHIHAGIVYTGRTLPTQERTNEKISLLLLQLKKKIVLAGDEGRKDT